MTEPTPDLSEKKMPEGWTNETALAWIAGNFRWNGGFIKARPSYVPTQLDLRAIQWLVDHEDYAWEPPCTV
jgi:hypothetical protein